MDSVSLDHLSDCLSCSNDVETLELLLAESYPVDEVPDFINADFAETMRVIQHTIPTCFTPCPATIQGSILCKDGEALEETNKRKLKMLFIMDDRMGDEAEEGFHYATMII